MKMREKVSSLVFGIALTLILEMLVRLAGIETGLLHFLVLIGSVASVLIAVNIIVSSSEFTQHFNWVYAGVFVGIFTDILLTNLGVGVL